MNQASLSSFIWSVADLLRGNFKQSDYGKVTMRTSWCSASTGDELARGKAMEKVLRG